MAHDASHTQPLSLECGHCTVHILLFAAADDYMGPVLSQTSGDGEANPTSAKRGTLSRRLQRGKGLEHSRALDSDCWLWIVVLPVFELHMFLLGRVDLMVQKEGLVRLFYCDLIFHPSSHDLTWSTPGLTTGYCTYIQLGKRGVV